MIASCKIGFLQSAGYGKIFKKNFTNLVISDHKSIWNENKNLLVAGVYLKKIILKIIQSLIIIGTQK